jgi:hypothetical protein
MQNPRERIWNELDAAIVVHVLIIVETYDRFRPGVSDTRPASLFYAALALILF